jgi:hypothetical protein
MGSIHYIYLSHSWHHKWNTRKHVLAQSSNEEVEIIEHN